jgi:hypothetical protein
MADLLQDVRCRGCRRLLGIGKDERIIYCDIRCATDYPASASEARDALMYAVYLTRKYSFASLGEMFGFTRQRAAQIAKERDVRPENR